MAQDKKTPVNKKRFLIYFGIFLAICAIAIAGYAIAINADIAKERANFQQNLNQQNAAIDAHEQKFSAQQEMIDDLIDEKFASLKDAVEKKINQFSYKSSDYRLLKARYYLEIAQINSHWNDDLKSTVELLNQADRILKTVHDSKVFKIRQQIATDITNIESTPQIDYVGILSKLDSMQQMALELPVKKTKTPKKTTHKRKSWNDSIHLLEKLVVVHNDKKEIQPIISPIYAASIRQAISLLLLQTQWAVLNKNEKIYQLTLKQATTLVRENFYEGSSITTNFKLRLKNLQEIKFQQASPKPSESLNMLKELLNKGES